MGRYDDLLNKLKKVIAPDKNLVESIYGSYDYDPDSLVSSKWGVLAATNKRIIIYKEDSNIDSFQFENISSIELEKNIEGYIIKILLTDGRKKSFEAIKEGDPKKLFDHINNKIKNNNSDIYDKIERIFELKEKGILTEEEFNKEKERLLNNKSNEISLKSENKLNKYTKNKQQTHITDSPAKKNNDDDDEKHNSKNINENFSREWEQCPRCGSNNTEKEPGFWGMTIRTGIGMAILLGVLSMLVPPVGILLGTRLGILAAAIAALSLFLGLISIINPDFKCKDCGANWNADKKNKSNKKKKKDKSKENDGIDHELLKWDIGDSPINPNNNLDCKKILLILAAIFIPIIGAILVLRSDKFSKKGKIAAGIWLAWFLLSILLN